MKSIGSSDLNINERLSLLIPHLKWDRVTMTTDEKIKAEIQQSPTVMIWASITKNPPNLKGLDKYKFKIGIMKDGWNFLFQDKLDEEELAKLAFDTYEFYKSTVFPLEEEANNAINSVLDKFINDGKFVKD